MEKDQISRPFINAVCAVIENKIKSKITKQGYKLVLTYLDECDEPSFGAKGHYAVKKYICEEIPSLEEIRADYATGKLSPLATLILKMEFEAKKLEGKTVRFY
jgi:hypothetical protein